MTETNASLNERETAALHLSAEVTETHLRAAIEIVRNVMKNDSRYTDGALLGAVVGALSANFVGLLNAR